jgi:hypothetical protein
MTTAQHYIIVVVVVVIIVIVVVCNLPSCEMLGLQLCSDNSQGKEGKRQGNKQSISLALQALPHLP